MAYPPLSDIKILKRFTDKFSIGHESGCWEWECNILHGYGRFCHGRGKHYPAHRVLYEYLNGKIEEGLELDHLCRNKKCINPYHLEPVTHAENVRRATPFINYKRADFCHRGHKLEGDNLKFNRIGYRRCKSCHRDKERERYHRNKG